MLQTSHAKTSLRPLANAHESILSVGDRVRAGVFPLHSRFARAVNFLDGEFLVSVVGEAVGEGPLNIVMSGLSAEGVQSLRVGAGEIVLGAKRWDLAGVPVYHSGAGDLPPRRAGFDARLTAFAQRILSAAPDDSLAFLLDERRVARLRPGFARALAQRTRRACALLLDGETAAGVRMLGACGFGLTPSGDDFLAGLLLGLHFLANMSGRDFGAAIRTIRRHARGGGVFSRTFLHLAGEGLFFGRLKAAAAALLGGGTREVREGADALLAVGHCSGADLAAGFIFSLRNGDALWS
ncbi:MAG: DUF2877 domain-containing protein [Elusimicrobiota bacterium]